MLHPRTLLASPLLALFLGCSPAPEPQAGTAGATPAVTPQGEPLPAVPRTIEKPSGLKITITENGTGSAIKLGMKLRVHYRGLLASDGSEFDSSYARGTPLSMTLGVTKVIQGWVTGLQELRVGDKARFEVPAKLGWGEHGLAGMVPPDADLVFEIEVVDAR